MKSARTLIICLLMQAGASHLLCAQPQTLVGLNLTTERSSGRDLIPGIGLTVDRQLSRHSGISSGLYYRTFLRGWYAQTPVGLYTFTVSERFLYLPLTYTYYTRWVHLAAGLTFEHYTGWRQRDDGTVTVQSYSMDPVYTLGLLLKVSRQIALSRQLCLEPELRFNPLFSEYRSYWGIGLQLKYRLPGR
ncbi:MAG: hypothetical protein SF053_15135 [Bacteroidia bacterium]|nr:hypothetical protein [Bacteroidia bacterium]